MATAEDHTKQMVLLGQQQTPDLTDLTPGSVIRSIFEAVAVNLELVEWQMVDRLEAALQESAYKVFAFDRKAPTAASGDITLTATQAISASIPIPLGTRFQVPGTNKVYASTVPKTFPAGAQGSTLLVPVASIGTGTAFNTGANTIIAWVNTISVDLRPSNTSIFSNGADLESDNDRLARFRSYIRSLHRGTAESLEYGVKQAVVKDSSGNIIESVSAAKVVEGSAGTATCYFANTAGTVPSAALLAAVQSAVSIYKAAGVSVTSTAATLTSQAVTVALVLDPAVTLARVKTSVQLAITNLLASLQIGEPLYLYQLARAALAVPGVLDAAFSAPTTNIVPASNARIVISGTPTIT